MRFTANNSPQFSIPSIILTDTATATQAEIFCFGGLLNSFSIQLNNITINVVDGYANINEAIEQKNTWFKSCKLSPFVCRLNNGKYQLNNTPYKISTFYLGNNAMHGIVYDAIYNIETIEANDNNALVVLTYNYLGIDKGYPFSYNIQLIWKLEPENKLSVTSIIINKNEQEIPYCEGWHPYFKLDEPIDNCTLQFDTTEMLEFDKNLIPTGNLIPDKRFINDTTLKNIELDNCFLLSNINNPKCVLKSNKIALTITPDNAYSYLQIFIPNHRNSIAIENLSAAPDAFNNKMGLLMLEPNNPYIFSTTYQIKSI